MDNLIVRSLQGSLSTADGAELAAWRRQSAVNEALYQRRVALWRLTGRDGAARRNGAAPAVDRLIERAGIRPLLGAMPNRSEAARNRRWVPAALVAALLLVVVGVARLLRSENDVAHARFGAAEFVTGATEVATVRLDDGTVVRLAPDSRLRFDNGASSRRRVWFTGRAYFAVARDSTRPFTIHTPVGEARVLGTRFELKVDPTDLRLVVVEGRVALAVGKERVEVGANQVSYATPSARPSVMNVEDVTKLVPWVEGLLVFQETPLDRVASELERRFGVTITITDSALAKRAVTAWFREQDFDGVLNTICRAVAAQCTIGERSASIRP